MILYYAIGSGLGHLTRAQACVHTLALRDVRVLTNSLLSRQVFPPRDRILVPESVQTAEAFPDWIRHLMETVPVEAVYMDAFPAGMQGEMLFPPGIPLYYIARRLRWQQYAALLDKTEIHFDCTYETEGLEADHQYWIQAHSHTCQPLTLHYPDPGVTPAMQAWLHSTCAPRWLVVHSGPEAEVETLVSIAQEQAMRFDPAPAILVCTPGVPLTDDPVQVEDWYPAWPLFPYVDRIFTACGYNVMQQTLPWRDKHYWVPFERPLDDQFARSRAHKVLSPGLHMV
ncbi:MAG: hypothetical protein SF053_02360 [Bacteroidia bacterium]|nr:hypothetical protein [Bacteroidia bacterium]